MELDAVLRERRSMRKYQPDRKVSREQVEEILNAATLAPSWKNSQTARYYVVMSDDMLKKVKETCLPAFNQTNSKDAPVLIVAAFVKNRSGYENDGTNVTAPAYAVRNARRRRCGISGKLRE